MAGKYSRRSFVKKLGVAGVGLTVLSNEIQAQVVDTLKNTTKNIRNFKPTMKYREVGKTGIYISAFSIGTTRGELEAISAGVDKGVNFIHTCPRYMNGRAMTMVAQAIKGRTDKVHIALKDPSESPEEMLKTLGITCADFIFFPRHDPDALKNELPEIRKKFMEWKDKGMVKFAGITSHKNMAGCIDVALTTDFISCVMPSYGPVQIKELEPQREALRKKGIGIIAMKTKGELDDAAYPAQITAALSDSNVASVLRGVKTLEELNSWTAAANAAKTGLFDPIDRGFPVDRYSGCSMCGSCDGACPNQVAVADIVRCVRYYHTAENDPALASEQFKEMELSKSLAQCTNCGLCDKACPQRIGVRNQLDQARRLWMSQVLA
jgi:predicted aldo/keto reductase-like oxidoreductase